MAPNNNNMKFCSSPGNGPAGAQTFRPKPLLAILALLCFGAFAARATAPVLILPASVTLTEDQTLNQPIGVTDGAVAIFTVRTTASSSNTNLISNASLTFNGSGTNRLLALRPGLHKSGTATITVVARDSQPAGVTNTFSLTVNATNYPPVFRTSFTNQTKNQNAATFTLPFTISDIETAASALTVAATSTNTTLVPNANLVVTGTTTNRTLAVTLATNQNGRTLIEVVVTDAGGAKGTNDFILNVWAVNQRPTFTMATNRLTYNENFGPVSNANFITGVSSGPPIQSSQSNYFVLRYTTNFYAQAPALDTNGNLTFEIATNTFGSNAITFILFNNGPTTNGGHNSLTNTLTLNIPFVNQAPTNALSTNLLLVSEETASVTRPSFLTALSAGPANENRQTWTFTATTVTNNSTNAAFATLPSIATNGTLTFAPKAHSFGTNTVTVVMTDNGGTTNGGINAYTNIFQIGIYETTHAPTIAGATNRTILENTTNNLTATISVWSFDPQASNFVVTASSPSNTLTAVSVTGTNTLSPTNATYTLTFVPVTNAAGAAPIQIVATEGALSTTNVFTLTITPVNQAPSFSVTNLLLVSEETASVTRTNFLTSISAGPANESRQTWAFAATTVTNNSTNAAFVRLPSIATNGTLTFAPKAHSFGTNTVTVVMTDNGGTTNGGVNAYTNIFQIGIYETNHAPTIAGATNRTILENTTNNLTATISVWSFDPQASNFVVTASSPSNTLTAVSVTGTNTLSPTNATYTLTFVPVTNAAGAAPIQIVATEGALSTTNVFTLTITPVNQAPSFSVTNLLLVSEETASVTRTNFLTSISAGPANESRQTWAFAATTVTNNSTNAAFVRLPSIATNGTLTFAPKAHSFGTNTVTVVMTDNGGTTNGGVNAYTNIFQIGIYETNHAPTIAGATNRTILENTTNNLTATISVWSFDPQASNFVVTASSPSNTLTAVSVTATNTLSPTNATYTLTFVPVTNAAGAAPIQIVATEGALSTTNVFTLTITPVNQAPSFSVTNLLLVSEETASVTRTNFLTSISAGPANESRQTWTFAATTVTNNSTNAAFATLPSIATNGTLTFAPKGHSFGTNTVTVVMTDNGGTTNGGVNAYTNIFQIGIYETTHAPTIAGATNRTILENTTNNLTATISVWSFDPQASNFVVTASSPSNTLTAVSVTATNTLSPTNATYTLTFVPVTNAAGAAPIQIVATEGALSTTNVFTLTITPVNQAPSFSVTNLLLVSEETASVTRTNFLTSISAGPANESRQTWTFAATTVTNNSTNAAFATLPSIATNGTLTFAPKGHSFGTNTVTVVMTDNGGTTNGGVNAYTNIFQIGIYETTHAPTIAGATNRTILENTTNNLTATISVWSFDPQASNFVVTASSPSNTLTAVSVTATNTLSPTNATYTLTFVPVTNAAGAAPIQIVATEGALSTTNVFTLTITPVNQAPSFSVTNLLLVSEETASVTRTNFLTSISAGPANESRQTWTFAATTVTNNSTNAAFVTLPSIATNGTLTFAPKAHSFGTNTVTVVMTDNGGTTNGGVNSYTNIFQIGVFETNHAPTIAGATNRTILENTTNNLTATVSVWSFDPQASNFVVTASSPSNTLTAVSVTATNTLSPTNATYTLTFVPVTNAAGAAPIQIVATEGALSTTNVFTLTITPVNQAPSFSVTNLLLVSEETVSVTRTNFLTSISAGPANESRQTWTFAATTVTNNSTNAAFVTLPSIATNGTLTFAPKAHSFGTNTVTVVMTDNGGTTNGGVNSYTNIFQIGVFETNHAPTIAGATNRTILENTTNNLTATVSVWSFDPQASNFVVTASSPSNTLTAVSVTATNTLSPTNATYTLTFVPVTNAAGAAPIQIVATEGALSTTNVFTLTITPVNQAPSFSVTNLLLVSEETASVTRTNFLTSISAGPANESRQTWTFAATTVTNNSTNAAFATLPSIATNGTLTFAPKAHSFGTNTVTVVMTDNGGTTNGGVNSYTNIFQIGVFETNHAPTIAGATNRTILENTTNNLTATISVWSFDPQASNFVVTASSPSNTLTAVSVTATNPLSPTNATYTLTFVPVTNAAGAAPIQIVATEGALSTTNVFTLTITPVNQAPSFSVTNLLLVSEETASVTRTNFLTSISAGPANESRQTWTFAATTVTNNSTNAAFATLPSIATNGTLTFAPKAHSFGTNTVTVVMTDNGGTTNAGVNAYTNIFQIGVFETNHAPTIAGATNRTILENTTNNLTATVSVWSFDPQASNFVVTASSPSNTLTAVSVTATNTLSPTNATYTLTFVPVTNAAGAAPIQIVATEGALSTTNVFTLTITPVNQAPSFGVTNTLAISENTGLTTRTNFLTSISAGPANESSQTWTFAVFSATNNATNATFAVFPTVSTNGTLAFRTATNSFGTNTVTIVMTDSGSTNNGGVNAYSNSFQLQVAQVQYPPAFSGITNKTILENATTNLSLAYTLYDPLTTNLTISLVSGNTNLVNVTAGGSGIARTVIFAPVTNANGSTTITITADNGSLTNSTNFTLTITPVNQPPSFNLAVTAITVDKYDIAVAITNAVTNTVAGPTNESSQTVSFNVTNSNPGLFLVPPSVNSSGVLAFTPAASGGVVTVGIRAQDTGGTANGGVNVSPVQTLTITIPQNAFSYLAGPFAGLFYDTNTAANASSGYFSLALATNGTFSGYLLSAGNSNIFSGQFGVSNAHAAVTASTYNLDLTVDTTAAWTETVTGSISNSGASWNAPLLSYRAGYSATFPTSLAGTYLFALPGFADPADGPAGDSLLKLAVTVTGAVSLTGYTADDTYAAQSSLISTAGYYPLYVPLYNHGADGALIGWLAFTGELTNSVTSASTITWFNDAGATALYPAGFTNQAAPFAAQYDSTLSDLLSFSSGTVILSGGDLSGPVTNLVTLSANVITVDPSATNGLSLTMDRASGEIIGTFVGPNNRTNVIDSVILQNTTNVARGYFIGPSHGGSFILLGN